MNIASSGKAEYILCTHNEMSISAVYSVSWRDGNFRLSWIFLLCENLNEFSLCFAKTLLIWILQTKIAMLLRCSISHGNLIWQLFLTDYRCLGAVQCVVWHLLNYTLTQPFVIFLINVVRDYYSPTCIRIHTANNS